MVGSTTDSQHAAQSPITARAPLAIAERDGILMLLVAGVNLLIYAQQLIYPYLQTLDRTKLADSGEMTLLAVNVLMLVLSFPIRMVVGLGLLNDAPYARRAAIYAMLAGYGADLWLLYQMIPSSVEKALEFDQAHIWSLIAVVYGLVVLLYVTCRIVIDMTRPTMVQAFVELARPVVIPWKQEGAETVVEEDEAEMVAEDAPVMATVADDAPAATSPASEDAGETVAHTETPAESLPHD